MALSMSLCFSPGLVGRGRLPVRIGMRVVDQAVFGASHINLRE
jgi:hypothetical protein